MADDGGGDRMGGGDLGEVEGERGDCEIRVWGRIRIRIRARVRVFAVVVFDERVKFLGY